MAAPALAGWITAEFTAKERRLIAYWLARRQGAEPPAMAAIAPASLRPWFGELQFHRATADGRYRVELSGKGPARAFGTDTSGRFLDEVIPPAVYASCKPMFDRTRASGRPTRYRGRLPIGGEWRGYRRLLLPLRDGGADVLMSLLSYDRDAAPPATDDANTLLGAWELTEADLGA